MSRITFEYLKNELIKRELKLLSSQSEYKNGDSYIHFEDKNGFRYSLKASNIPSITYLKLVGKYNQYSIYNINIYLKKHSIPFECISHVYLDSSTDLEFVCKRCGNITFTKWTNVNRHDGKNRHHILCDNCDGRVESLHASILKQMFLHEYPETIVEELSCRNPKTNKTMPTDIVNHKLKIAIEIQSQWHDLKSKQISDAYKKQFWINKGYKFYDPDIRDYTVLEMCQLFFDISVLPDYINYEYGNKINIKKIQRLLDDGMSVIDIEKRLEINRHRIYDALYSGKLSYPENYKNACFTPIVQLDKNGSFICEHESLMSAQNNSGVSQKAIGKALRSGKHYSGGYYWIYKDEYNPETMHLHSRFSKFHIPVNKYDMDGNYICTYNTIIDASKDNNVSNTQICKTVKGILKYTGGYIYKLAN